MFLKEMESKLTSEDKKILSDIYDPVCVAEPCADPWGNLTLMRDGSIRFYGWHNPSLDNWKEYGKRCYIESEDCGLSWKKHLVADERQLQNSSYIPFGDKYCKVEAVTGETVGESANASFVVGKNESEKTFFDYKIAFDCEKKTVETTLPDGGRILADMKGYLPDGICYLHLQTEAREDKEVGIYIKNLSAERGRIL